MLSKKSKWVFLVLFFLGMLSSSLSSAYADDPGATATAEPDIVFHDMADRYYLESDETDDFGNHLYPHAQTSYFPLCAMIKSENIFLYCIGKNTDFSGMILYKDGQGTYFDWPDLVTRRDLMPKLSYMDYNEDGEKEIAVILDSAAGTAWIWTDLHMLRPKLNEWGRLSYTEYTLESEDIDQWFMEEFSAKFSEDMSKLIINFAGHDYLLNTKDEKYRAYNENGWDKLVGVGYGKSNTFYFTQSEEIKVAVGIEFEFSNWGKNGYYFGDVEAKVNFDGEKFTLSDYRLIIS